MTDETWARIDHLAGLVGNFLRTLNLTGKKTVAKHQTDDRNRTTSSPAVLWRRFRRHDKSFRQSGIYAFFRRKLYNRQEAIAFLEKIMARDREKRPSLFAVVERKTGPLIGFCGFLHQDVDNQPEIEIGYRLDPGFWDRGLATGAARAVRDHAFRDLNLSRVISLIHPDNMASRRVAEKNGMQVEKETLFKGFPTLVFAITQEEWKQVRRGDGAV